MRHIKKFEAKNNDINSFEDIDPFGEEIWDEPKPKFKIGEMVKSNSNQNYGNLHDYGIFKNGYYYITNIKVFNEYIIGVSVLSVSSGKSISGWFDQNKFDKIN